MRSFRYGEEAAARWTPAAAFCCYGGEKSAWILQRVGIGSVGRIFLYFAGIIVYNTILIKNAKQESVTDAPI